MKKKERIAWLDVMKGILILFVLLSHSSAPSLYTRFFVPFFLTMFFFVSGYTFSIKDSFHMFIIEKIRHLLIPLVSMGGVKLILAGIMKDENTAERIKGLLFQISGQNDDLWFIGCMFSATILFYCVVRLSDYFKRQSLVFCLSCILSITGWVSILILKKKCPWQMENALVMTFYMGIGYLYRRYEEKIVSKIEKNSDLIIGMGCVYIVLFVLFDSRADIHKGIYTMPGMYVLMSLIAIPVLVVIAKQISCIKSGGVLQVLGKNTLFLYAFENYVIQLFYKVCNHLKLSSPYVLSIVCVALTAIILMPIAEFANRYIPWIVGGKK